jgi:signal transduction histidine kinase
VPLAGDPTGAPGSPSAAQVTAAIAHEVRTPLAVALMYLSLVEQEAGKHLSDPLRDGLSLARAEVARVDRLLANLVDLHRLGRLTVRPTLVDAGRVVSDAVRAALRDVNASQVTVEIGGGDLHDWWDAGAVEQIVHNLLAYAVHHGDGEPIAIAVDRRDESLRLSVRYGDDLDEGDPGTDAFGDRRGPRRAGNGAAVGGVDGGGSGLEAGLWLVRALALAHEGNLATDAGPGAGAAFTVTLDPQRP